MLRLRTEGIVAAAGAASPPEVERPETYNDFVGVGKSTDYSTINAALAAGKNLIFLREGNHAINNPVTINTDRPVYIHGFACAKTVLKAQNLGNPMFIIQNCPLLSIQRVVLDCAGALKNPHNIDQIAIDFQNTSPTRLELGMANIRGMVVANIQGPGEYILQNVNFASHGMLTAAIVIDHPGASLWFTNGHTFGDAKNKHLLFPEDEIYHIWQKRGHVELYTFLTVAARGEGADFRFDTRSPKGCHVVAGIRSEGVRNTQYPGGSAHADGIFPHLIYVPPTSEQVDILLLANEIATHNDLNDPNPELNFVPNMFRYNGAGTLWAFGNTMQHADHLVAGNAPNATIIAAGNDIMRAGTSDIAAGTVVVAGNLRHRWTEDAEFGTAPGDPRIAHNEVALLDSFGSLPEPPVRGEIPTISTPRVEVLHPFMELKNVKTVYGAVGDGLTDDTTALQNAINAAGDRLFFPAGTYRITAQLALHYNPAVLGRNEPGSTAFHGFAGGWWAGAGQATTKIQRTNGGRVFISGGMSDWQIQDMAFQTSDTAQDCFHVSRQTNFSPSVQTSHNTWSNCTFIGGSSCLGWANDFGITGGNINCESMLAVGCTLQNGIRGVDNGRDNAFGNTLLNCNIQKCTFAFRSQRAPASMIQCTITGCDQDFQRLCFTRSHYFGRCTSDSPVLWLQTGGFSIDWYFPVWDNCTWTGLNSGSVVVEHDYAGGPTFLHCTLNAGRFRLTDDFTTLEKIAFKLWSTIPEWDASKAQLNQTSAQYHSTD